MRGRAAWGRRVPADAARGSADAGPRGLGRRGRRRLRAPDDTRPDLREGSRDAARTSARAGSAACALPANQPRPSSCSCWEWRYCSRSRAAAARATAADANEPNDGLDAATPLTAGYPLEGVLTAGDSDVFGGEAPAGAGATRSS